MVHWLVQMPSFRVTQGVEDMEFGSHEQGAHSASFDMPWLVLALAKAESHQHSRKDARHRTPDGCLALHWRRLAYYFIG